MSVMPTPNLPLFNPFDPVQKRDPYAIWQHARAQAPVFFSPVLNMWVVTRYDDIMTVLRDPATFSSAQTIDPITSMPPDVLEILYRGRPLAPTLINNDPPTHTRIRSLCNKAFTPQRIAAMEGQIRELANTLIDKFVQEGRVDIIARYAYILPRIVIGDIVGVPREDIQVWGKWVDDWASFVMEDLSHEQKIQGANSTLALQAYNDKMIAERMENPRGDLLSDLIHTTLDDGSKLSADEVSSLMVTFLVAGHNTVTDFIGNAVIVLSERQDIYNRLAVEPELAPQVVEEILRYESPSPGLFRVTTQEAMVGDVLIPKGMRMYLLYASANRDEEAFPNADHFDINRPNIGNHLAMGRGIHYCVGAPLARLEGRITLQEFAKRLPNLRVVPGQSPFYKMNPTFRGPLTLEVEWDVPSAQTVD